MKNSEKFINSYNEIDNYLRSKLSADNDIGFTDLVRRSHGKNLIIKRFKEDLIQFAYLRNAIVHTKKENFVIAEPNDEIVVEIQNVLKNITTPKRVDSVFKRNVFTASKSDSIETVLTNMVLNDFSQAPIIEDNIIVGMLNAEAVSKWLGKKIEEDIISLKETKVEEVLSCSDTQNNFKIIKRKTNLFEVQQIFIDNIGRVTPLEALIITENGKPTEAPIGIITRTEDLATIIKEIGI